MLNFLAMAFRFILKKFVDLASFHLKLILAFFVSAWLFFTDVGVWIFEQLLKVLLHALSAIDFDVHIFDILPFLNSLPSELLQALSAFGFGYALTLLFTAYTLRILLSFVPFFRF